MDFGRDGKVRLEQLLSASAPLAEVEAERGPLRPGDPVSWGAITRGTALEGEPYRYR